MSKYKADIEDVTEKPFFVVKDTSRFAPHLLIHRLTPLPLLLSCGLSWYGKHHSGEWVPLFFLVSLLIGILFSLASIFAAFKGTELV